MKMNHHRTDATHNWICIHNKGNDKYIYKLKCLILKEVSCFRVKILVFGEKQDPFSNMQRVKYVRMSKIEKI